MGELTNMWCGVAGMARMVRMAPLLTILGRLGQSITIQDFLKPDPFYTRGPNYNNIAIEFRSHDGPHTYLHKRPRKRP